MSQQSDLTQKTLARIQENVLASAERRLLTWLCAHMPAWVTPDVLTATGMVGALAIFVGYAASGLSPAWLGVALIRYVILWFGVSLAGSRVEYPMNELPSYSLFLPQLVSGSPTITIID